MLNQLSNEMAKRKVIQIANSTKLISLPMSWVKAHNVQKGDELSVTEDGNHIIVSTERGKELAPITINVTDLDRDMVMFVLRGLYKAGYDEVRAVFDKPTCRNLRTGLNEPYISVISQEVSRLNGYEIFTERENYCLIRSISDDTARAFDTMLRRIFLLSGDAIKDFIDAYISGDKISLAGIQGKHNLVTRFVAYSQRLLHKVNVAQSGKASTLYHILELVDIAMDLVKYCSRDLLAREYQVFDELVEIYKEVNEAFLVFTDLYYKFSLQKASDVNRRRHHILSQMSALQNRIPGTEAAIISNMRQLMDTINNLTVSRIYLQFSG